MFVFPVWVLVYCPEVYCLSTTISWRKALMELNRNVIGRSLQVYPYLPGNRTHWESWQHCRRGSTPLSLWGQQGGGTKIGSWWWRRPHLSIPLKTGHSSLKFDLGVNLPVPLHLLSDGEEELCHLSYFVLKISLALAWMPLQNLKGLTAPSL